MKIILLLVGQTDASYFRDAVEVYCQRLKHFFPFEVVVAPDVRRGKKATVDWQKEQEGRLLARHIEAGDYVVLLDERGREFTSAEFAHWMEKRMASGIKRLVFVTGGAYGFSPGMYAVANEKIALSQLTFSHQMVRLVFVEQLYRAAAILNNLPYHHP